jgi:hypothetical protein
LLLGALGHPSLFNDCFLHPSKNQTSEYGVDSRGLTATPARDTTHTVDARVPDMDGMDDGNMVADLSKKLLDGRRKFGRLVVEREETDDLALGTARLAMGEERKTGAMSAS